MGTLSIYTIQCSKNDGHVLDITIKSGIMNMDPPLPTVELPRHDEESLDETLVVVIEKEIGSDDVAGKVKSNRPVIEQKIRQILRPPIPFPHRLKWEKKNENSKNLLS